MTELTLRAFLTLFVVVDPVGIAPVFLALTGDRSKAERVRIARRAVLVGGAVLFFVAIGGPWLLARLGISMDAFRLAIPFIAGPGAMASTMILVGQAGADPRRLAVVFAMAPCRDKTTSRSGCTSGQSAAREKTGISSTRTERALSVAETAIRSVDPKPGAPRRHEWR
jgi:hypothetical protein